MAEGHRPQGEAQEVPSPPATNHFKLADSLLKALAFTLPRAFIRSWCARQDSINPARKAGLTMAEGHRPKGEAQGCAESTCDQ